jgi:hypothetical protein
VLNPFHEINWRPGLRERRKFALSLVVGFPCVAVGMLLLQRWHGGLWNFGPALTLAGVGAALGVALWLVPHIARPFYVVWYGAACAIGFVTGNAVLAAVYLLLLAPMGIAMHLFGRRAISKTFDRNATTYWRDAPTPGPAERYYRQF